LLERKSADSVSETTFKLLFQSQPNLTRKKKNLQTPKAPKPKTFLFGFHLGFKKEKQERKIKLSI